MVDWKIGDEAIYDGQRVKIVRGSYPRYGEKRVVVQRLSDKRRFTVTLKRLTKPTEASNG